MLSVFIRKNFVSLSALLFSVAFFFWVCRCSFVSPLRSFCFRKANPAHTRVPQKEEIEEAKGES
jgi:hypothetical protein